MQMQMHHTLLLPASIIGAFSICFTPSHKKDATYEVSTAERTAIEGLNQHHVGRITGTAGGEWVEVGILRAPHGVRGEIKVQPLTDFPEDRLAEPGARYVLIRIQGLEHSCQYARIMYKD